MTQSASFIPRRINSGPFVAAHSHAELKKRLPGQRIVLPVCPLGTPATAVAALGDWVLPPLYREALDDGLLEALATEIRRCFPYYPGSRARAEWQGSLDVVEITTKPPAPAPQRPRVVAFSVDTAVEQHGPHLPLATDTLQSYGVLERLAAERDDLVLAPPVDYGQLTWGLPFGMSIDVTAPLITRYVTGYANAVMDRFAPDALYVVDVHGSIVHRNAVQAGLAASRARRHGFRWLYDPIQEFGPQRGDTHAGGIETAVIHGINPALVDDRWWPQRIEELAAGQMTAREAIELSPNLPEFVRQVESRPVNGIIGDVHNFFALDGAALLERMCATARADVEQLLR